MTLHIWFIALVHANLFWFYSVILIITIIINVIAWAFHFLFILKVFFLFDLCFTNTVIVFYRLFNATVFIFIINMINNINIIHHVNRVVTYCYTTVLTSIIVHWLACVLLIMIHHGMVPTNYFATVNTHVIVIYCVITIIIIISMVLGSSAEGKVIKIANSVVRLWSIILHLAFVCFNVVVIVKNKYLTTRAATFILCKLICTLTAIFSIIWIFLAFDMIRICVIVWHFDFIVIKVLWL